MQPDADIEVTMESEVGVEEETGAAAAEPDAQVDITAEGTPEMADAAADADADADAAADADADADAAADADADAAADADADADAAAGDATSQSSASPRSSSGISKGEARNVNVVIVADSSAAMVGLMATLLQSHAAGAGISTPAADIIKALSAQQKQANQQLIRALQAIAIKKR